MRSKEKVKMNRDVRKAARTLKEIGRELIDLSRGIQYGALDATPMNTLDFRLNAYLPELVALRFRLLESEKALCKLHCRVVEVTDPGPACA